MTGLIVSAVVLFNILGCLWLIWWTARLSPDEDEEAHVWDDDLRELNNPLPRWWLNLFILTIVFGLAYLVAYPGLLWHEGSLGWSSAAQHDAQLAAVQARRRQAHAAFDGRSAAELATDPRAQPIAAGLFAEHCAGCHGPQAQGAVGFPNLRDGDWLYGGSPESIAVSIRDGRQGAMPPFLASLPPASVPDLIALVGNWQDPPLDATRRAAARTVFERHCAACHGAGGGGNSALGAPDLTDDVWLYGKDPEQLRQTILFGRQGAMPAHGKTLSEVEIRLLTALLLRLSTGAP